MAAARAGAIKRRGPSRRRRYRTGLALGIHRHIGEEPLGHLDPLLAAATAGPALDLHRDRGGADLDDLHIAAHLVADEDRTVERHGGDRDRDDASLGAPGRN